MPTREQLESALINADKAGDINAAKQLAMAIKQGGEIVQPPQEVPPKDPAEVYSGFIQGLRDPVDGLAQLLYEALPEGVRESGDALNNWLSEKTGFIEKIPEGGFTQLLKDKEARYQAGRVKEGDEGADLDRIGGNFVSMAVPGAQVRAVSALGKVAQGAALGAGYGAALPTYGDEFWVEKGMQAAIGSAAGGALSASGVAAGKAIDAGKRILRPMTSGGRKADVTDTYQTLAGSEKDKIISALKSAKKGQTSAQAIANANRGSNDVFGASIVRLEKDLSKKSPITDKMRSVYKKQSMDRKRSLDKIAKTDGDLAEAIKQRDSKAAPYYDAARKSSNSINVETLRNSIDGVIRDNINDTAITIPLKNIQRKLKDATPRGLISTSSHIKRLMNKTIDGKNVYDKKVLTEIKEALDKSIEKSVADYDIAREIIRRESVPINRMKVGQELKKSLIDATEQEKARPFVNALREAPRTVKRATGFTGNNTLENISSRAEMETFYKIRDELLTDESMSRLAKGVDGVLSDISTQSKPQLPNALVREIMIANHLLKRLAHKDYGADYQRMMLDLQKNPKLLAKVLQTEKDRKVQSAVIRLVGEGAVVSAVPQ